MDRESFRYDVLSGLFNIGVEDAADMLSGIVQKRIGLQVLSLELPDFPSGPPKPEDRFREIFGTALMVSTVSLTDRMTGRVSLVFPAGKMRRFVALCSQEGAFESEDSEFTDVDFDVIREIGNIVLNCILGELKKMLDIPLTYDLPRVTVCDLDGFDRSTEPENFRPVLILTLCVLIEETETEGAVVFELTEPSSRELFRLLDGIEAEL